MLQQRNSLMIQRNNLIYAVKAGVYNSYHHSYDKVISNSRFHHMTNNDINNKVTTDLMNKTSTEIASVVYRQVTMRIYNELNAYTLIYIQ